MVDRPCRSLPMRHWYVHSSIAVVAIAPTRNRVRGPADRTSGEVLSTISRLPSTKYSLRRLIKRHYVRSVGRGRVTLHPSTICHSPETAPFSSWNPENQSVRLESDAFPLPTQEVG